jgi:hypothetical protein
MPRAAADVRDPVRQAQERAVAGVLDLEMVRDDRHEVRLETAGARIGRRLRTRECGLDDREHEIAGTASHVTVRLMRRCMRPSSPFPQRSMDP